MRARVTLVLVAAALAGCGPTQPQAPKPEAQKLDSALGGISYACGEADQIAAFGDDASGVAALDRTASGDVDDLVSVYRRNQAWIYQSETIRKLVKDAASTLESCGLHRAARRLAHATG